MSEHRDTVIVGAGITGLVAAWLLGRQGKDFLLLEAKDRPGGLIQTSQVDGFLLEHGPFTILPKSPPFRRLLEYAADDLKLVTADRRAKARRFVVQNGKLVGIHGRLGPLTTRLYGPAAKARILRGLLWSRTGGASSEDSIYDAVSRRFGPRFATWAVDPLIRGIVSGDCRELSLQAMFPSAAPLDQRIRSPAAAIVRTLLSGRRTATEAAEQQLDRLLPPRPTSVLAGMRRELISFREGLAALPRWLAIQLQPHVRYRAAVAKVERTGDGFRVQVDDHSSTEHSTGNHLTCRRIIVTTPAHVTAGLIRSISEPASIELESIPAASLAVVHLGFAKEHLTRLPDGFGFLVPTVEDSTPVLGTLFASRTFPHHAPAGRELLRVFLGGTHRPDLLRRPDEELTETALAGIRELLGVTGAPELVRVDRFIKAIPQYNVGHRQRLERITEALRPHAGLVLAGSYRDGVSVSDRVAAGFAAADESCQA